MIFRSSTFLPTLSDWTPRSTLTSPFDLLSEADDPAESRERTPRRVATPAVTTTNKCWNPRKEPDCVFSVILLIQYIRGLETIAKTTDEDLLLSVKMFPIFLQNYRIDFKVRIAGLKFLRLSEIKFFRCQRLLSKRIKLETGMFYADRI